MERQYDFQDMQKKQEQKQGVDWSEYKDPDSKSSPIDWSEYIEVEPAKPGDKADAVVIDIRKGNLGEFLSPEALEKWRGEPTQPCIQVVVEGEAQGFKVRESRLLTLPVDKKIRRNSNLYKWKKLFGGYPFIGQKVFLIADSEGYFKLTL